MSDALYFVYTLNPLAGIIDAFQRTVLHAQAPDPRRWPALVLVLALLPFSYAYFKRAEAYFADVV